MNGERVLSAPKGFAYTNGVDTHGYDIFPADGVDENSFYLITEEEFQRIMEENANE
jgi:hypothetical protein